MSRMGGREYRSSGLFGQTKLERAEIGAKLRRAVRPIHRLAPPTSAPGLGPPLPHLRRDSACPSHIWDSALQPAASNNSRHGSVHGSDLNGAGEGIGLGGMEASFDLDADELHSNFLRYAPAWA